MSLAQIPVRNRQPKGAARMRNSTAQARKTIVTVVSSLSRVSETFIEDRIEGLNPGNTLVLCLENVRPQLFDYRVVPVVRESQWTNTLPKYASVKVQRVLDRCIGPRFWSAQRRQVLQLLVETQPTAVFAEYGPNGCLMADLCHEIGIPLYVYFHGYDASFLLNTKRWVSCYRQLFRNVAGVFVPSTYLAENLMAIGCAKELLHVIPCGVEPDRFICTKRTPNRILAVGRLVEKKAPHLAIEAFGKVCMHYPDAQLDIVGSGPLADSCAAKIRRLSLEHKVRMRGAQGRDIVNALLQEASVFIQHSVKAPNGDSEGMPVAVLEAMASALPVVSTRHSGIMEAVLDGDTGLLVDEHDVDGMASAITTLLDNPVLATRMGEAGRCRVISSFTQQVSLQKLRDIMGL